MERMAEWMYYLICNYSTIVSSCVQSVIQYMSVKSNSIYIYIDKITRDEQCGFGHNGPTTDQISCICQVLQKTGIM